MLFSLQVIDGYLNELEAGDFPGRFASKFAEPFEL
jgi:hypothetical protein